MCVYTNIEIQPAEFIFIVYVYMIKGLTSQNWTPSK